MDTNDKLLSFRRRFAGKTASVIGIGISNRPLISFLLDNGLSVVARDKKEKSAIDGADALISRGVKLCLGEHYLDDLEEDIIFRTPGMRPDHPALISAVQHGAHLTSEIELLFDLCPCPIFAITGSDGKTTTTTITSLLLKESGRKVWLGGNIGTPLIAEVPNMNPEDTVVLELSSFQLMTLQQSPTRAIITNLTENHLDWHTDMDEYLDAKKNIFKHQTSSDLLVLNKDNPATCAIIGQEKGKLLTFSRAEKVSCGVYLDGDTVYRSQNGKTHPILNRADIRIPGLHNVENFMAAIALTDGLVTDDQIRAVATTFPGVAHRCQFIREKDGVKYYNSSIDSTPARTTACLRAFTQKVIVICGGYDKQLSFAPLVPLFADCAKGVVLCGATAKAIQTTLENTPDKIDYPVCRVENLSDAVKKAQVLAEKGDIVVLSPACASFDAFKNFEERGKHFVEAVMDL